MSSSLYARYIKERENREIVEDANGFATYSFHDNGATCYIADIYVLPEFRKNGIATKYADQVLERAKAAGAKILLGSVDPRAASADVSRQVLGSYGMNYTGQKLGSLELYAKEIL